jgi:regulator of sirC expression with transglutaminase-like and TPR domain
MGANDLFFTLRESGFSIHAKNSRLQIVPAKKLTNNLKQTIQQSKIEILCALHQEEELTRLVRLVSDHHGFSREDYEEALIHALSDPINALTCFASLAHKAELE